MVSNKERIVNIMTLSDIRVMYYEKCDKYCLSRYYHTADVNSKFKIVRDLKYAYYHDERLPIRPIVTSETYYIDDVVVDEKTWVDVFKIISDNIQAITGKAPKRLNIMESDDTEIWSFMTDDLIIFDESFLFTDINEEIDEYIKNFLKGDNSMKNLTITNYKYNPETKTTTIWWSDNSQTSVTADPDTEANEFTGFCAACAKKLFGNKSTYLNQFDKWAVKKPEQEKKKAEAEKAKAEEQAKIEAERAERAKEKEANRLAKLWAKQYKRENERIKIAEVAEKIAKDKYGIPDDWFGSDCCCECGCKEFDKLNTEDITTEDTTDDKLNTEDITD